MLFLKVKDPLEFKLFFIVLLVSHSLGFLGKTSRLLFPQSKHLGPCPRPATPPFAGFCHQHWFLQETVSGATEQV